MTLTASTVRRAVRIQESGRVREITGARTFQVTGDQGDQYLVTVSDETVRCNCDDPREVCKHIAAAGLQIREDARA